MGHVATSPSDHNQDPERSRQDDELSEKPQDELVAIAEGQKDAWQHGLWVLRRRQED